MPTATNPQTGETVFLDSDGNWSPAKTATNPQTKETLAFDGNDWVPIKSSLSDQAKGLYKALDAGVASGIAGIGGLPGDLYSLGAIGVGKATNFVQRQLGLPESAPPDLSKSRIPDSASIAKEIQSRYYGGAEPYKPQGTAQEYAHTLGQFGVGAPLGGGGAVAKVAQTVIPAALSETAGQLTKGTEYEPYARFGAALTGAGGTAVGGNLLRNAVSPQANVSADLGRALLRDKDTPAAIMQRLDLANTERPGVATLADVGGENVKGLVERVAQTPGAGRTQVVPALTAKQQGQAARISNDLKSLTGTNRSAIEAVTDTMAERKAAAAPLYDQAYSFDLANAPNAQPAIQAFLDEIGSGWGKAIINSPTLKKTLQTEYGITGQPGPDKLMPIIDAWKKAADDIIRQDPGSNKSRVLRSMLDRVIPEVDAVNPAYAQARNAWSGPTKYLEAIDFGRGITGPKLSADEFAAGFKSLTTTEQEAARIGVVSSIISKMGNDPAKLADMTKYLRSPEMRAKVGAIMPDAQAAKSWENRLNFEVGASELTGRALGNSATYRRMQEAEDAKGIVGDLVLSAFRGISDPSYLHKILTAGPKWLKDTLRSRADALLADTLTKPQGAQDLSGVLAGNPVSARIPAGGIVNATAAGINSPSQ